MFGLRFEVVEQQILEKKTSSSSCSYLSWFHSEIDCCFLGLNLLVAWLQQKVYELNPKTIFLNSLLVSNFLTLNKQNCSTFSWVFCGHYP